MIRALQTFGEVVEHGFVAEWPGRVNSWWRYPGISTAAIGGFIGSSLGGLIDNESFAGTTKVERQRLGDGDFMSSVYGAPIARVYGSDNCDAGNLMWAAPRVETVTTEQSAGKGKGWPSVEITIYSYSRSIAILHGEGVITGLKMIKANGRVIFDRDAATLPVDPPTGLVGMIATLANEPSDAELAMKIGELRGQVQSLQRSVDELHRELHDLRAGLEPLRAAFNQVKGGWAALLVVAAVAGSLGALATKLLGTMGFGK